MDPRKERTRTRVLAAAQELLEESGPAAVTYTALAARSGVGRATLYRHWPDVDSLMQDLLTSRAAAHRPKLIGDLEADLRLALATMNERIGERKAEFLTMLERANRDPAARLLLETMEQVVPVRHALELAVANGDLPSEFDVPVAVSLLLGPLLHREFMTTGRVDEGFISSVVDSFLRGAQR